MTSGPVRAEIPGEQLAADYITGVARMGSRLIILLQLEKALLLDARGDS
jgi:chemotaxis signal transduction protein